VLFNALFVPPGAQGFETNLTPDEIIGQLWLANFYQDDEPPNY
jgi:23S rRNA (adenine2503-C2)-methyltransferase